MIGKAACIGGGVIGAGWVARFALNGIDVAVFDPDDEIERKVGEVVDNAERALRKLCVAPLPEPGEVTFANSLAEAVEGAGWVQESVPERLEMKRVTYDNIAEHAPDDALIGSSTSGFKPSELTELMPRGADRVFVAHPFNPVYLLPLVELVGSPATGAGVLERAASLLRPLGMHPLVLRQEIEAHIADRLLEAVWREALWMVRDGIATTSEIDEAIRMGFGLRWAQMGLFETYRIAGGEEGMSHFLAQFGPTLALPWTRLTDVPELTPELVAKIAAQSDDQSGARSIRELERIRDDNLVGILHALKANDWGAGRVVAAYEKRLREVSLAPDEAPATGPDGGLVLHRASVLPEWCDYNGHMTEFRYLHVFGDATDAFLKHVGMDTAYLEAGRSIYTLESHVRHLREVRAGAPLAVETRLLGHDAKRIRIAHVMRGEDGTELATGEHMLMGVDTGAGKAAALAAPVPERLAAISQAAPPDWAGRGIRSLDE